MANTATRRLTALSPAVANWPPGGQLSSHWRCQGCSKNLGLHSGERTLLVLDLSLHVVDGV